MFGNCVYHLTGLESRIFFVRWYIIYQVIITVYVQNERDCVWIEQSIILAQKIVLFIFLFVFCSFNRFVMDYVRLYATDEWYIWCLQRLQPL